jgi:D-alanyl-D-alanine carboxypeptidase
VGSPSRSRRLLVPLLALTALAALLPLQALAAPSRGGDLEVAMRRLVRMPGGPPGVAVTVQRGQQRQFHSAGVGNLASGARWRASDHMRIASVAKAFSGATALSLVSAGKFDLDDRIGSILPWLPPTWKQVTVAELLSHTGGIPDYTSAKAFGAYFSSNLHACVSPRQLVEFVSSQPLDFKPGTEYRYSNTDNILVGLIAAEASGRTYSQVLREAVLDPLGLGETSLPVGFRLPSPHVHGYEVAPPDPPADVTTLLSMAGAWASGGIQSTAANLNGFIRGYLGLRLFDGGTQQQQFTFVKGHSEPPGPGVNSAGLGIFRYETPCGVVYGHTGNLPGFTQFAAATPGGRRSVTVSVNARVVPTAESAAVRDAFVALRRLEVRAVCAALAAR